ncbi:MAG: TolB family protein [Bacteroidetes bacterium]|nr:TolB family protein [Bacteroidota bacterium]
MKTKNKLVVDRGWLLASSQGQAKSKWPLILIFSCYSIFSTAQITEKEIFGEVQIPAALSTYSVARFDEDTQEFILEHRNSDKGGPIGLMGTVNGNFLLTCRISSQTTGIGGWTLTDNSNGLLFSVTRTSSGLLHFRTAADIPSNPVIKKLNGDLDDLQIERNGNSLTVRASAYREPLALIYDHSFSSLPNSLKLGMFLESANSTASKIIFSEVRLDKPVTEPFDASRSVSPGSRLEILDLKSGSRKVIYESTERFEAPNFMPDGKSLLFNMKGLLYTISTDGGTPKIFETGSARRNNNDHGISFDGKLLALSSHRDGMPGGGSAVYVMPLAGGEPKLVTGETPSYWHGWNPNHREVLYVAQRNGSKRYQIYSKDINGGKEVALTSFDVGHVDGPEFSPHGKHIYYNGSQTGKMQLWRMNPDGKNLVRLTFDDYNNWFPHPSPDGKALVFLSYLPDIDPDAHPAYKKVMIRMMAAGGGPAKVLAHLYGGQGTINVPSWSPDGRFIAFVSNSRPSNP